MDGGEKPSGKDRILRRLRRLAAQERKPEMKPLITAAAKDDPDEFWKSCSVEEKERMYMTFATTVIRDAMKQEYRAPERASALFTPEEERVFYAESQIHGHPTWLRFTEYDEDRDEWVEYAVENKKMTPRDHDSLVDTYDRQAAKIMQSRDWSDAQRKRARYNGCPDAASVYEHDCDHGPEGRPKRRS